MIRRPPIAVLLAYLRCRATGCDLSWVTAAQVGSSRPVCRRCGKEAAR